MSDLVARKDGKAGRFRLNRPGALNALTYEMCLKIESYLGKWEADPDVELILFEGAGERAFCAGGDITAMYKTAVAGDYDYGRQFWTDEYRLNAKLATSPKPIISFLHGFTMGGGVGLGCHLPHRIVCESSQIAMPECGIGLVPDVGGSLLLARAPGRFGEYLGTTASRMGPADAIFAGFADHFIPQEDWPRLIETLCDTGDVSAIAKAARPAGPAPLLQIEAQVNEFFRGDYFGDIVNNLNHTGGDFAEACIKKLSRSSPLAMAATIELIHRVRGLDDIVLALGMEYRFTYRAAEQGDFIEGIRAMVIDKDKSPKWRHAMTDPLLPAASAMLRPLGPHSLDLTES